VWIGTKVAPRHRFATAVILAVIYGVLSTAILTLAFERGFPTASRWWDIICIVVGVVATIIACFQIRSEGELDAVSGAESLDAEEPSTLTPETAEPILDIVSEALQQDAYYGTPYHPLSSLNGHDVFQVDTALKLRTANDLLLLASQGREAELDDRAKQVETIPQHVATQFVEDSELNKLCSVPRKSPEYMRLQMEIMPDALCGAMDSKLGQLELLSSFATYCQYVSAKDPLYWQKVYSRLDIPYCKACPRGNDPVWL